MILSVNQVIGLFIRRRTMETTFQETRVYCGIGASASGNDLAIARATPHLALLASVTLIVHQQRD